MPKWILIKAAIAVFLLIPGVAHAADAQPKSEAYEKGLAVFRAVYGDAMADGVAALADDENAFGHEQARLSLEWPFGSIWTRDGLDPKLRSCAVLGMLIGMGNAKEIQFHVVMGLHNGLTRAEIEEIFYTSIPYAGFPASNTAKDAMLEGFRLAEKLGKVDAPES